MGFAGRAVVSESVVWHKHAGVVCGVGGAAGVGRACDGKERNTATARVCRTGASGAKGVQLELLSAQLQKWRRWSVTVPTRTTPGDVMKANLLHQQDDGGRRPHTLKAEQ